MQHYLEAERAIGRVARSTDVGAIARTLAGAALFESFIAAYHHDVALDASSAAARIVGTIELA